MLMWLFVLASTKATSESSYNDTWFTGETKVREDLLHEYQIDAMPPYTSSVNISISYTLLKIFALDEKKEQLQTVVQLTLRWIDERLVWDSTEAHASTLNFALHEVWFPRVVLYNNLKHLNAALFDKDARVIVNLHGWVKWTGVVVLTTPCELDITMFPLDAHICQQEFRILPDDPLQNLEGNSGEINHDELLAENRVERDKYSQHSIWYINRTRDVEVYAFQSGIGSNIVKFSLRLKRKYQYYLGRILAPVIILSALVTLVFFIPPEAGEKISFSVILLLTFSVFQMTIDHDLPTTSDSTPLITIAMVLLQICTAMSMITSVIVLNLHHWNSDYAMPTWTQFIFFKVLARFTCQRRMLGDIESGNEIPTIMEKDSAKIEKTDLESLLQKILETMHVKEAGKEWKVAALILDRVLMYVIILTMVGVYAALFSQLLTST